MKYSLLHQSIGLILIIIGISIFIYWILLYILKNKNLTNGFRTIEKDVGLVIFHITAELIAGIFAIVAGLLLFTDTVFALPLVYVALGMQIYIGIRTLSWSLLNNNKITPNLLFVILFSIISLLLLLSEL